MDGRKLLVIYKVKMTAVRTSLLHPGGLPHLQVSVDEAFGVNILHPTRYLLSNLQTLLSPLGVFWGFVILLFNPRTQRFIGTQLHLNIQEAFWLWTVCWPATKSENRDISDWHCGSERLVSWGEQTYPEKLSKLFIELLPLYPVSSSQKE